MSTSLPTDSAVRKTYPLFEGLFGYFGAALGGVAHHSHKSNEKHNPGEPLHWSIDKSTDHADCVARHLLDLGDMLALAKRGGNPPGGTISGAILDEANALAWRALALCQVLHMQYRDAPLPFNARRSIDDAAQRKATADDMYPPEAVKLPHEGYPSPRCPVCKMQTCSGPHDGN